MYLFKLKKKIQKSTLIAYNWILFHHERQKIVLVHQMLFYLENIYYKLDNIQDKLNSFLYITRLEIATWENNINYEIEK
jgi:ABC-type polysaccharide/polyol phosphate export permease